MIRLCVQCGKPFRTQRSDGRFCSSNCRVHHHRGQPAKPWAGSDVTAFGADCDRDLTAALYVALELGYRVEFVLIPNSGTAGEIESTPSTRGLEDILIRIAEQRHRPL